MGARAQKIRTRCFVLVLCAFVLLFGFDAKLSAYEHQQPNLTPIVSSKLWLGGQQKMGKIEAQSAPDLDVLLFCAILMVSTILLVQRPVRRVYRPAPIPLSQSLFEAQRYLRPPPAASF